MPVTSRQVPLETVSTRVEYQLDQGPGHYRIGLIALATDHATERDFRNMSPGDEVAVFVSRVLNLNPCTVENLRTIAPRLTEAASLILPGTRLDAIAYSCTSGTVVVGYEEIAAYIRAARPGIPCTTPITAAIAGFEKLGVRRIAVLTPYIDEVNQPICAFLENHGVSVMSLRSFNMEDDTEMARLPPTAIRAAALEADHPDAEAVFISCTAIRAAEVVQSIEDALGKPVVSSVQALYWEALRFAGCETPIAGFGQLMRI